MYMARHRNVTEHISKTFNRKKNVSITLTKVAFCLNLTRVWTQTMASIVKKTWRPENFIRELQQILIQTQNLINWIIEIQLSFYPTHNILNLTCRNEIG